MPRSNRPDDGARRPRAQALAASELSHAEIFTGGPTQVEIFGLPTSTAYGGRWQPEGLTLELPDWYGERCEALSRARWRGQVTQTEAQGELDFWHPIALRQMRKPSSRRRKREPGKTELERLARLARKLERGET